MRSHMLTGRKGEILAQKYLRERGYEILGKNVRTKKGEIDLIARQNGVIVFVEVKARSANDGFRPIDRINQRKIMRLHAAGLEWLSSQRENQPARIDVIGVCGECIVEHVEDVTVG